MHDCTYLIHIIYLYNACTFKVLYCSCTIFHLDSQDHMNYEEAQKLQLGLHTDQKNKVKSDQHAVEGSPRECSSTIRIQTTTASQIDEGAALCIHSSNRTLYCVECTDSKDTHKCNRGSQFSTIALVNAASSFHQVQTVHYKYSALSKDASGIYHKGLSYAHDFHDTWWMIPNNYGEWYYCPCMHFPSCPQLLDSITTDNSALIWQSFSLFTYCECALSPVMCIFIFYYYYHV